MSSFGFWIPTGIGVVILLYSIVIYTHSYWHDRELRNPRIIGILMFIGFALTSTPYWDEMGAKIHGGYEFEASRKQQEQEMKIFVSTKKPIVDKLPPGNPNIIIFNNFNSKLQEFHKEPDVQKRSSMLPDLYKEYMSTSTAVEAEIEHYKIKDLTE
jgi:hypothetical protein